MIGVISKSDEREIVEEFFQLFKTPWEFYYPDRRYDVVIATVKDPPEVDSSLFVVFGTEKCRLDKYESAEGGMQGSAVIIEWEKESLPIYEKAIAFSNPDQPILCCSNSGKTIGFETRKGGQRILRIGYDLFKEVLYLLSKGQPPQNASVPTLDLHIAMLRNWIVETGIPLVEIPPVPEGYRFIACLTHDIDFIGIRPHFLGRSMWGFLYRATVGSIFGAVKRRVGLRKLRENFKAALSLPLVFLGVCRDPWYQFDRCLEIEGGLPSTFFFIPFKNQRGQGFCGGQGRLRAARYDVTDVGALIRKLLDHGCEIGVHGIDAWHSAHSGEQELQRIRETTASQNGIGIRMHWLCRDDGTFEALDEAGYSYDSTLGYNEAVGFKAGTAQAFKPIGVSHLLEIPLTIQDTALFGHGRMNSSEAYADQLCQQIIDHVGLYGGVLTTLWHQRSLGPERLWAGSYEGLVGKLREKEAWFATAGQVADWFRMRRSARFEEDGSGKGGIRIVSELPATEGAIPGLVLRHFRANAAIDGLTGNAQPAAYITLNT